MADQRAVQDRRITVWLRYAFTMADSAPDRRRSRRAVLLRMLTAEPKQSVLVMVSVGVAASLVASAILGAAKVWIFLGVRDVPRWTLALAAAVLVLLAYIAVAFSRLATAALAREAEAQAETRNLAEKQKILDESVPDWASVAADMNRLAASARSQRASIQDRFQNSLYLAAKTSDRAAARGLVEAANELRPNAALRSQLAELTVSLPSAADCITALLLVEDLMGKSLDLPDETPSLEAPDQGDGS